TEQLLVDDSPDSAATAPQSLPSIDTSPVGMAVFDRVLLTVHPTDCAVQDYFVRRMQLMTQGREMIGDSRAASANRLPPSPADLMLRIINHLVDGYLDLRRLLTRQFGYLQQELLGSRSSRFTNWHALLDSRN